MKNKTWTKSHTITALMVALFLALMFAGCDNKPKHLSPNPYTIIISSEDDSTFTLMDGNRKVATFKDAVLDSITIGDNE